MAIYSKKKHRRANQRNFFVPIAAIVVLIIFAILLVANINMYQKRVQLRTQIESLGNKVKSLEAQNVDLQQGIAKSDDGQYIEKIAREELDLQRPGEKVFSFVEPKEQGAVETPPPQNVIASWFGWVSGWFKK